MDPSVRTFQSLPEIQEFFFDTFSDIATTITSKKGLLDLAKTIRDLAFTILRALSIGVLFLSSSTPFVLGFSVGICSSDFMESTLKRIRIVWSKQPIFIQAMISLGGVIAWPIALPVTAFFSGGWVANKLCYN